MFDYPALLIILLGATTGVILVVTVFELLPPEQDLPKTNWRDTSPLLFRPFMSIARRYSRDIKLAEDKRSKLEEIIASAGLSYTIFPEEVVILRWLFCISATLCTLYATYVLGSTNFHIFFALATTAIVGYYYPILWLQDAVKRRQREFEKNFPFLLELLSLSMRAGLTFSAALQQASVQLPQGAVQQELVRVMRDIRTGTPRAEALDHLSDRVQLSAVTNFVAAVIQAEQSGSSLGPVLADQAKQRRRERFARAEKLANEAPVKMLLPLVTLLFPITFLIISFPIIIEFMQSGATSVFG